MKQFLITLLAVGVLASAAQAEARLKSTRGQCLAACGQAVSDSCGWITKRGKFNRCRTKLINQCKRFGAAVMCPAPAVPPVTTPTTLPVFVPTTTTTTITVPRPTTTTLPPVVNNPALPYAGTWNFLGALTMNTCPQSVAAGAYDTLAVTVLPASPGAAQGYLYSAPQITFSGGVDGNGDLGLEALIYNANGCVLDTVLLLDGPIAAATYQTAGGFGFDASCPSFSGVCRVIYTGTWTRS